MKKAVIKSGGKQYLVSEGDELKVELLKSDAKTIEFEPILFISDSSIEVGTPSVAKVKVTAELLEADVPSDKVTAIRYKAKKRVHKVRGHRQRQSVIKIKKIA
jgi:large subunit ribosomal protein L21